ncbi:HAMP domain-containing methyl-accepting chemotaxis protein [Limisphaera sp. 4302-co]|uniref:HAMP domain-containing methyl-accepting chemotaxis protein n=1 Tax=Limisphaera sp. 4302-co TaxID=3400417 RepID=UPI003C1C56EF
MKTNLHKHAPYGTLTLGKRLAVAFATVVSIVLVFSGIVALTLLSIHQQGTNLAEHAIPVNEEANQLYRLTFEIEELVITHLLTSDVASKQQIEQQIEALTARAADAAARLNALVKTDQDKRLLTEVMEKRNSYVAARKQLLEVSRNSGRDEAFTFKARNVRPQLDAYLASVRAIVDMATQDMITAAQDHQRASRQGLLAASVFALLTLGAAAGLGLYTHRKVLRLTAPMVGVLQESATQVASAAAQVTSTSQSLAQGASEQAASLEETSASLEELTAMTQRNAANAQQARQLASQTRTAVEAGQSEMSQLTRAMDDIQTASAEISKIIKTIDEIAFQTNLLALNAAVEAARAGEAGMGFAVVADEVRALAQRAAAAARETAEKIENSVAKSRAGADISQRVAQHLQDILTKARHVDELVAEIAAASQEQSQGIGQINAAVSQMDKVTQANAAAAEQSAAAAQELNAQAASLRQAVQALLLLVGNCSDTSPFQEPRASLSQRSHRQNHETHTPGGSLGVNSPAQRSDPEPALVGRTA